MKIFHTQSQLRQYLHLQRETGKTIGLVPTMGALHAGHLSLIGESKKHCALSVATIFVNPTQFNNADDLKRYPKPIEKDIELLTAVGCDVLFNPDVAEMYAEGETWDYEVGPLDTLLEGEFRPGHYKGVTQIVHKLFSLVQPDVAFFGQKDYQQYLVIKKMVSDFRLAVKLVPCAIVREADGLAMSSRNVRLNDAERKQSLALYNTLLYIKDNFGKLSNAQLEQEGKAILSNYQLEAEYLKIVDRDNLLATDDKLNAIVLVACFVGETRLIDNMMLP
ncbi:pantoate--beta-alanine ligase [Pelobium manganitolerans]|uniref:Pantothenate synthetase n=1 Tax=Pelobium manganitolerans TaxID=1842495 RepID=A0A419S6Y0_9SPHI|nr:pantoate--beta-alanine ligase [Pelobium manganitolerans]RKD17013.1 pantoate--beta-alanine ligase [Pelobium manganitolerans]